METWCFKTATRQTRGSSAHQWYWQLNSGPTPLLTSIRLFETLEDCVADAQDNGFRGALHVPEILSYPAVLTWSEGAPLEAARPMPATRSGQQAA
jgi:hypothetical protein